MRAMGWTSLCELDELTENVGKFVEMDGFRLAVFRRGERVFVIDDACPHAGASLSAGQVSDEACLGGLHTTPTDADAGGCVVCPWHGWAFRLADGTYRDAPGVKVDVYRVRLYQRGDGVRLVQVDLPRY